MDNSLKLFRYDGFVSKFCVTMMVSSCLSGVALAQSPVNAETTSSNQNSERLEDIIVIAQKREQNLQDVGIAVTAFTGDQLKDLGITKTSDFANQTPGLVYLNTFGGSEAVGSPTVRGVTQNDFTPANESPNALYIDGVYISFLGGTSQGTFDVAAVEILKGPQGTLYGRNATGGLLHITTRKPTDHWEGNFSQTIESYNGFRTEAAIGGPLGEGLSFRLAGYRNSHDGYVKNLFPGATSAGGEDDTYAGRAQLQYKGEKLTALLTFSGTKTNPNNFFQSKTYPAIPDGRGGGIVVDRTNPIFDPQPGNVFANYFNTTSRFERKLYGITLDLTYDISDSVSLKSITNYQNIYSDFVFENDFTGGTFPGGGVISSNSPTHFNIDADQFTQEFRVSKDNGDFRWVAGLYYLRIKGSYLYDLNFGFQPPVDAPSLPKAFTEVYSDLKTESYAGFVQGEFDFTDQLTAIAGFRVTRDQKDFFIHPLVPSITIPGVGVVANPFFNPLLSGLKQPKNGTDYSFKVGLNYKPTPYQLFYASITRGTKAGGFQLPNFLSPFTPTTIAYDGEVLTSYEIGSKSTFWDRKARFNITAFYYDYKDFQSYSLIGVASVITNLPAKFYGGEAELTLRPGMGFTISAGVSYLHTTVYDYSPTLPKTVGSQAPKFTANFNIAKDIPLGDGNIRLSANGRWTDHYFQSVPASAAGRIPGYFLSNAKIGYESHQGWSASFTVNNVFDKTYKLFSYDAIALGFAEEGYGRPRWYAGEFTYRF